MSNKTKPRRSEAPITKRVIAADLNTGEHKELATFHLDKRGRVHAEWTSAAFKEDIEANGIEVAEGIYFPADGRRFIDNLELAFSHSTRISVEDITGHAEAGTLATSGTRDDRRGINPRSRPTHRAKHTRKSTGGSRRTPGRGRR